MHRLMTIGLLAALFLPIAAAAQETRAEEELLARNYSPAEQDLLDYYGDIEFITIATGSRKPIHRAPAVATVITADQIKAMGARHLDEVLETVAGLHVVPSTQGRLDSIYSIRGIHTKFNPHVLVLINGNPFPFFTGGRPFHFRMPVAAISRVEVVRGPGSAVYGADAFSGVVNIITKDAYDINGAEVGGRAGSFETHDLWIQYGKRWDNWEVAFSLEWQQSEGDKGRKIDSDLQTRLDSWFGTDSSLAPGPLSTRYNVLDSHLELKRDNWRLRHWYWRQDNAGLGAGSSLALDPTGGEDISQHFIDLFYGLNIGKSLDLSANATYLHRKNASRMLLLPPGSSVPIGSDGNLDFTSSNLVLFPEGMIARASGKEEGPGFDLVALYTGKAHRWRLAAGIWERRYKVTTEKKNFGPNIIDGSQSVQDGSLTEVSDTPYVFIPNVSRTAWYISLQDEWQFARDWELTAGVRYDKYSDFGDTINPRVALVWAARHNLTNKLLYGKAFRAPSLTEKFSINNPVVLGNPSLNPETIDTLELSFDYRPFFDLTAALSLFYYEAKDLIEYIQDPNVNTATASNARDQEGYGYELEVNWKASETLSFKGHYAWQSSEDKNTGQRIPDAPGEKIYLSVDWRFLPEWSFFPQYTWVGSRHRGGDDLRPKIKDYNLVNLMLRRSKVFGKLDLAIAIKNVFDENTREPGNSQISGDYPLERRHFWGELAYRF